MQSSHKDYSSIRSNWHLRLLGAAIVIVLWMTLNTFHLLIHPDKLTLSEALVDLAVILVGTTLFGVWASRRLQQRDAQIQRTIEQLESLHEAALAVTAELDLDAVLQKVVDMSRSLVGARYGALSVLDEDGDGIQEFVTSGLSAQKREEMGPLPRGHGLLAVPIRQRRPISITDVSRDPRAIGFPPNHPSMQSLLAVPIIAKGKVIGSLFLTDKLVTRGRNKTESTHFSPQDQHVLVMFATQAAIAIENARLYHEVEQLAILQERERFSRNLHDGIIQSIYAIGLLLEDGQHRIETEPTLVRNRIGQVISDLNDVILDIRSYILGLRPQKFQNPDLQAGLEALVYDLRVDSYLKVDLEMQPIKPGMLSAGQAVEILHIAQEALANVHRHSLATRVSITLRCEGDLLLLTVDDNGTGFDPSAATGAGGLHNMQSRARVLNGQLQIDSLPGDGAHLKLTIPL